MKSFYDPNLRARYCCEEDNFPVLDVQHAWLLITEPLFESMQRLNSSRIYRKRVSTSRRCGLAVKPWGPGAWKEFEGVKRRIKF